MNEYFITYSYETTDSENLFPVDEVVREIVIAETAKKAIAATLDEYDTLLDIRKL